MFNGTPEYQSVLDKIGIVHSHGFKHHMSIPPMVIIGDQSSGKSSVLEALTKLSVPRDKDMCTRFPTIVNLQHNPTLLKDVMSAKIEGEEEFNKRFAVIETPLTFGSVIEEAASIICKNIDISDKVLEITFSGPTQSPLTLVDLPGYIDTTLNNQKKTLPDNIRAINRRFIQDPRAIILAIVPANADLNTSRSLSEAGAYDPDGERTIPIVTKPDRIEGGLLLDWVEVILNRRKKMKMGYLVMRNAGPEHMAQSWDESFQEEEKFFKSYMWNAIPTERKGRVAIRQFLSKVLREQIHENIVKDLPNLKQEVSAALETFKKDLASMGVPIHDIGQARQILAFATSELQPRIISFLSVDYNFEYIASFKQNVTPSSDRDSYSVRSILLELYHDYRLAMRNECRRLSKAEILHQVARYKYNDLPDSVSFLTFKKVINGHYMEAWKTITEEHMFKICEYLSNALSRFIADTADASARDVFTRAFERFSRAQAVSIKTTIQDIFEDESIPFTLSSHYLDVVHRERSKNTCTTSLSRALSDIDLNKDSIDSPPPSQTGTPQSSQPSQNNHSPPSSQQSEQEQENHWDADHTTAAAFMSSLIGYLTTARERIVDKVIMQTIERYMIKRITVYFTMVIKATNEELLCMLESPALKRRRLDFENKIIDFETIMKDL